MRYNHSRMRGSLCDCTAEKNAADNEKAAADDIKLLHRTGRQQQTHRAEKQRQYYNRLNKNYQCMTSSIGYSLLSLSSWC